MNHPLYISLSFVLLLMLGFSQTAVAQVNLVPNFSFEDFTDCPNTADQVEFATGWSKYSTNNINTTPDYFNACSSDSTVGVPQSFFFYQEDHRNCGAYLGVITWASDFIDYREQVGIQLSQQLIIGQKYFMSFHAVLGGIYVAGSYYETPSNNIGMRLSTIPYDSNDPAPIDNFAHIRSQTIISDTVSWVRISGSIVADSAYNYLMLGNFYDDVNTDTSTVNCSSCLNKHGYYLIDDVCVSTDSTMCNGGIDDLPCVVSVEENSLNNQFSIYPNPASDVLTIQNNSNSPFDVEIYNSIGQLLYTEQQVNSSDFQLDISPYNKGLLFIKTILPNKQLIYKLLTQ